MSVKTKIISIIIVLILGGVFLTTYTMSFKFVIVDANTDKKSLGVLNIGAIFAGTHKGFVEVDGQKYTGECTMTPTKSYEYKGDCIFEYEESYFICSVDATVESSEHNLTGTCKDESDRKYDFIGQKN